MYSCSCLNSGYYYKILFKPIHFFGTPRIVPLPQISIQTQNIMAKTSILYIKEADKKRVDSKIQRLGAVNLNLLFNQADAVFSKRKDINNYIILNN